MPIRVQIDQERGIVQSTLAGALAVSDYAESAREILDNPRAAPGFGLLVDGRALHPLPTVEELRELVSVARELQRGGIAPFALVAANEVQYLVGRLFAVMANAAIRLNVRVFRDIEVARDWLTLQRQSSIRESSRSSR